MKTMTDDMIAAIDRRLPGRHIDELFKIAMEALDIHPPNYIKSIFGPVSGWIPPYYGYSEFTVLNLWRLSRAIKYLVNTGIPSIPVDPPPFGPPLLNNLFWHPTLVLQRPHHNGSYTSFPDEAWIFINGIMTNDDVVQLNAGYLSYLFHRPITLVYNASDSFFIDLLKCAIAKEWNRLTEPSIKAFPVVYAALKDPSKERVVLIAHSHGTIIAANVLRWLKWLEKAEAKQPKKPIIENRWHNNAVAVAPASAYVPAEPVVIYPDDDNLKLQQFKPLEDKEFAKLEIYCFANCATEMTYYKQPGEGDNPCPIPWIENFGNEMDLVARLGMLAPNPDGFIHIDGPCYEHESAWGHLLNAHYLRPIQEKQKDGRKQGGNGSLDPYVLKPGSVGGIPRLFSYINGGVPD